MTPEDRKLVDIFMEAQAKPEGRIFSENILAGIKAVLKSRLAGPSERAYEELRCSLSTIYGLAASKGSNALHDIACTALAGIARLKAMDQSPSPATTDSQRKP